MGLRAALLGDHCSGVTSAFIHRVLSLFEILPADKESSSLSKNIHRKQSAGQKTKGGKDEGSSEAQVESPLKSNQPAKRKRGER
jgi:hypothetical protein